MIATQYSARNPSKAGCISAYPVVPTRWAGMPAQRGTPFPAMHAMSPRDWQQNRRAEPRRQRGIITTALRSPFGRNGEVRCNSGTVPPL